MGDVVVRHWVVKGPNGFQEGFELLLWGRRQRLHGFEDVSVWFGFVLEMVLGDEFGVEFGGVVGNRGAERVAHLWCWKWLLLIIIS